MGATAAPRQNVPFTSTVLPITDNDRENPCRHGFTRRQSDRRLFSLPTTADVDAHLDVLDAAVTELLGK
jgi:hypothetical protein